MSVNNAESRNYWLGGFWKNGSVRGVIWRRGRWYNGTWLKGQWYSNDLEIQWINDDPNKNKWSVWYGGIWKSNSREKYDLDNLDLDSEYSVWHGGIWKCSLHENATYTWQGENPLPRINIYGNIDTFTCDRVYAYNDIPQRKITLPTSKSLFLGGQWLRGEWYGGIFANSIWHSTEYADSLYDYLDELNYLYNENEYLIFSNSDPKYSLIYGKHSILTIDETTNKVVNVFDAIILYFKVRDTRLSYSAGVEYNKKMSSFMSGAFVNSVWEGGIVYDTSNDPYNVLFGMSLSAVNTVVYDDNGIQPQNNMGVYESNELKTNRYYGLLLPDWDTYLKSTNSKYQVINFGEEIDNDGNIHNLYVFPMNLTDTTIYSNIWKRGEFRHGTFNYSQFYNYDEHNNINTEYIQSDTINNLQDPNRFDVYDSIFMKGLFNKSIFYGGIFLAQYNADYENLKSSFSRSVWCTGYWAAATEYDYGQLSYLPIGYYTDDEYVTNARFWKSVWLNGIWEGGHMAMSAWNCVNPFNYNITINNETFEPSAKDLYLSDFIFDNIRINPLGKVLDFNYYDENGDLLPEYLNIISDLNNTDFLNVINRHNLKHVDIVINTNYAYVDNGLDYDDENNVSAPYDENTPYDLVLSSSDYSNPELVDPNDGDAPIVCNEYSVLCYPWSEYVPYGTLLDNDTELFLNDDVLNENIFRTLGLVHNLLSVWQNGTFEGGVWNGGYWIKGEFKPYRFDNYPDNVLDESGLPAMYDYFDDNIISTPEKFRIDNAIWSRGVFYSGYFRAESYFFAVPAYITDTGVNSLNVSLEYKMCINDSVLSSNFNGDTIQQLKALNLVSFFTRKAYKSSAPNMLYFSLMNGQFMSGYFQDRLQDDTGLVPVIGTRAPEFSDDLHTNDINKLIFGNNKISIIRENINQNTHGTEIGVATEQKTKNTAGNMPVQLNIANPVLYNPNNNVYDTTIIEGENSWHNPYTTRFFYEYSTESQLYVYPINRTNIKHGKIGTIDANLGEYQQPMWTDVDTNISTSAPIPSYAQGSGIHSEPYYEANEVDDPTV